MDYSFPPAPPGYSVVIGARAVLVVWSLIGVGIVVFRLRRWRSVQPTEIRSWAGAAAICGVVAAIGFCPYRIYDNNLWNWPIVAAAMSPSIAGITVCLAKVYSDGTGQQKRKWIGGSLGVGSLVWLVVFGSIFANSTGQTWWYRREQCKQNLKAIGLAMHTFHDERQFFPPATTGTPPVSWRVTLLPYLDQIAVYNRYDKTGPWNQAANVTLARERVDVWICPSNYHPRDASGLYCTAYAMLTGPQTVGDNPKGTRLRDILDGPSNTAMIVEACGAQIPWSEPRDVNIERQPIGINFKGQRPGHSGSLVSGYHYGAHILLADGAVRWMASNTDQALLQKLLRIDDTEPPDDF